MDIASRFPQITVLEVTKDEGKPSCYHLQIDDAELDPFRFSITPDGVLTLDIYHLESERDYLSLAPEQLRLMADVAEAVRSADRRRPAALLLSQIRIHLPGTTPG